MDEELQVRAVVMNGLPRMNKDLPENVKKYARRKLLLITSCCSEDVKWLYQNQSISSSIALLVWVKISKISWNDAQYVSKRKERKELQRIVPEYPFQMVSTDLINFKGDENVLLAELYSGILDFRQLKNTATSIKYLKQWFSTHGIPEIR